MTSNALIAVIFLAPTVLLGVVSAAATVGGGGDWSIVGVMTAVGLGTSALIVAVMRLLMGLMYHEYSPRFAAFAAAIGGEVRQNLLAERQVRAPHPRGRVELDLRLYGRYDITDSAGARYTRVALVPAAGGLPDERRKLPDGTGASRLSPAVHAEVAALRAAFGERTQVHLDGRRRPQVVEVWLPGWLEDGEAARRAVALALPHLEALASAPWSA